MNNNYVLISRVVYQINVRAFALFLSSSLIELDLFGGKSGFR